MKISSLFVLNTEKDCEILSRSSKIVDTILIRDRILNKKKLNFTQDSKIQKTVEDFLINSFI